MEMRNLPQPQPVGFQTASVESSGKQPTATLPSGRSRDSWGPGLRSRSRKRSRQTQTVPSSSAQNHLARRVADRDVVAASQFGAQTVGVHRVIPQTSALLNPARPRPVTGQTWLQVLNANSTAFDVAYALGEFFDETALCQILGKKTFAERFAGTFSNDCRAAPRKQLASIRSVQQGLPASAVQGALLLESSRRRALHTIAGSWKSTRSGLYAWGEFCEAFSLAHFPATLEAVRMFSAFFAHGPTFNKYLQHLRWAHKFLDIPLDWWQAGLQQVTKGACKPSKIYERCLPALRFAQVRAMIKLALGDGHAEVAEGFAVARCFLFRVGSEMIPLCYGGYRVGQHSGVVFTHTGAEVTLARRKNMEQVSILKRECMCDQQGVVLCGVHQLKNAVSRARREGRRRVFSYSYESFLRWTQHYADAVGVGRVGTHGFRRGMAQDMALQGCPLYEILKAGGWKSASFLKYMDLQELESGACAQFVADLSDSDAGEVWFVKHSLLTCKRVLSGAFSESGLVTQRWVKFGVQPPS